MAAKIHSEAEVAFLLPLLRVLRPRWPAMAVSVAFGLAFAGVTLIPPLLIRALIQRLTEPRGGRELLWIALGLVFVYLVRGVCRYAYGRFSHIVAYQTLDELMVRVYRHVQRLSHRFFSEQHSGALISRSISDVEVVEDFIAHGIPEIVLAAVIPATMLCVLISLNAQLALIVILPLPVAALVVYRVTRRIGISWRKVRGGRADLVTELSDSLSGISEIKSFARENEQAERVASQSAQYRDALIRAHETALIPQGAAEMAGGLGVILAVWFGGGFALDGRMTVADLFVFVVYVGQIYQPFLQLAGISDNLHKAASSGRRVFQLLALRPDIVSAPGAIAPIDTRWDIEFRDVTFGYDPQKPVIENVSFHLDPGETVALFGPTGAGKSTITRLLQRFYDPTGGTVRIGGHDLRVLELDWLRRNIGSVMQEVFLFRGTVRQNILFGRPEAGEEQLIAAARAANAEEFILKLPDGYDTVVGERGVRLSGGQRQRIAIARAVLKNAPILILDEATSAVDWRTEALIQEALERLMKQRTTLVIAHRLSTIRRCRRVVLLQKGCVAGILTNDEFFARSEEQLRTWELGYWPKEDSITDVKTISSF